MACVKKGMFVHDDLCVEWNSSLMHVLGERAVLKQMPQDVPACSEAMMPTSAGVSDTSCKPNLARRNASFLFETWQKAVSCMNEEPHTPGTFQEEHALSGLGRHSLRNQQEAHNNHGACYILLLQVAIFDVGRGLLIIGVSLSLDVSPSLAGFGQLVQSLGRLRKSLLEAVTSRKLIFAASERHAERRRQRHRGRERGKEKARALDLGLQD